jgi:hypothetical protein
MSSKIKPKTDKTSMPERVRMENPRRSDHFFFLIAPPPDTFGG